MRVATASAAHVMEVNSDLAVSRDHRGRAEYVRFIPNMETNVASSATTNLTGGRYDLSTAVLFPDPIVNEPNVNTVTTVEYYDAGA